MDGGRDGSTRLMRAPSLPDEIAKLLRDQVGEGTLKPGDRLPTEQQLCRMFGVSRPVVREAISQLKFDGVLESFQGRGVFVKQGGDAPAFRIEQPDLDDQQELAHILELLVAVEVAATGLAAERRTETDVDRIKQALEAMAAAIERGESGVDEDVQFHKTIVEVTENPFFISFVAFLESRVRNLIRAARTNTARFEGMVYEVQREHEAIHRAIAQGDGEAARTAAERHLRNAAARLKLYKQDTPASPKSKAE